MSVFNLQDFAAESRTEFKCQAIGTKSSKKGTLLVFRRDDGTQSNMYQSTFASLLKEGKITLTGKTTFTLKKDDDWKPSDDFTPIQPD